MRFLWVPPGSPSVCNDQRSGPSPVLVLRCSLIMMQEMWTYLNKLLCMIKENDVSDEAEVLPACAAGQRGRGAAGFHLTEVLITDGRSRVGWILLPEEGLIRKKKTWKTALKSKEIYSNLHFHKYHSSDIIDVTGRAAGLQPLDTLVRPMPRSHWRSAYL